MADEHGEQSSGFFGNALWLRLFTVFRIALDPKKLLLAGAGLLVMSFGWWFLSVIFFSMRSTPLWSTYQENLSKNPTAEEKDAAWDAYQADRRSFAKLAFLAGYPSEDKDKRNDLLAGLAGDQLTFQYAVDYADAIDRWKEPIDIYKQDVVWYLKIAGKNYTLDSGDKDEGTTEKELQALETDKIKVGYIQPKLGSDDEIRIRSVVVKFSKKENWKRVTDYAKGAKTQPELASEIDRIVDEGEREKKRTALKIAVAYNTVDVGRNQYGIYRTLPWFENRGPNPFLMLKDSSGRGRLPSFLANNQLKVLLEPLYKFLSPVIFLFDVDAGGWNRVYLISIILWTLATWAFFGAAITRMAAVQIARPNEKVGLMEAVRFVKERYKSFFLAPLCPLIFILALTVFLIFFGWISGLIPIFGDVIVAGLFWPVVIIVGLIMAVVLIGLVGWPLMYATISAEGSDSFDALSRSYSYVYQAPWRYLWYGFVALAYGAVLVFFVGLMGSLMVYLGKWGVSQAPFLASNVAASDREPSYLFYYAPTSFGWRDLLIEGSRFTELTPDGYRFTQEYIDSMTWYNKLGAFFVSIWIYIIFLFVVGFGYSYFWSSSTMIYLLLRQKVDDTDLDEVYLDDEEDPFLTEPPAAPSPAPPAAPLPQTTDGVTMVESPTLRTPEKPPEEKAPDEPPRPAEPKKTMLMQTPIDEGSSNEGDEDKPKKTMLMQTPIDEGSSNKGDEGKSSGDDAGEDEKKDESSAEKNDGNADSKSEDESEKDKKDEGS